MALTDDQKAMLRLLAQRGEEGYEDMAALMGISVEDVRERVREALAEAAADDATTEPPAPAPPVPEPEPPKAEPPPAPPAAAQPPAPKAPAAAKRARVRVPGPRLPRDRGALIGLGAGALVLLIFAVVLIVSGSDSGSDSSSASSAEGTSATAAANSSLTEAVLEPTNGGDSSGRALFGRYKKNVLLQVEAEGLDPSPKGKAYAIWLFRSPKVALQIGSVAVTASGKIATQFQVPAQLLAYVASGAFNQVDVSLISTAEYKTAFAKAKAENRLPPYSGESVLRGEITGPAIR